MSNPEAPFARTRARRTRLGGDERFTQQGVTLIELQIGVAIGLLVIAAALGTLLLSSSTAAVVNDISQLQQQGSYALRLLGTQFRQAGSLEPVEASGTGLFAFEGSGAVGTGATASVSGTEGGTAGPDSVSVASTPLPWADPANSKIWWQRDCLGNTVARSVSTIDASFKLDGKKQLVCTSQTQTQPVISNVADFQVRYRVVLASGLQMMTADQVDTAALWDAVKAIEVCLDLQGQETLPDNGAKYRTCHNLDRPRGRHAHLVFRNVFDLRTRGL